MNIDTCNGGSPSYRPLLPNGGSSNGPYTYLNNDVSYPPGGFPSLRLPVVVRPNIYSLKHLFFIIFNWCVYLIF